MVHGTRGTTGEMMEGLYPKVRITERLRTEKKSRHNTEEKLVSAFQNIYYDGFERLFFPVSVYAQKELHCPISFIAGVEFIIEASFGT